VADFAWLVDEWHGLSSPAASCRMWQASLVLFLEKSAIDRGSDWIAEFTRFAETQTPVFQFFFSPSVKGDPQILFVRADI